MTRKELDALAHKIAVSTARADVESFAAIQQHSGKHYGVWYDATYPQSGWEADAVKNAVLYLEATGQMIRHPEIPTLVRVKDAVTA